MLREPRNYDTVDGRIVCTRAHADGACTPVSGDEGVKKKKNGANDGRSCQNYVLCVHCVVLKYARLSIFLIISDVRGLRVTTFFERLFSRFSSACVNNYY